MTREDQADKAARQNEWVCDEHEVNLFVAGAEWADQNPKIEMALWMHKKLMGPIEANLKESEKLKAALDIAVTALEKCRHAECIAPNFTFKCKCLKCLALAEIRELKGEK